ncbi:MAG: hypothetical protein WC637_21225, partial [Victivallales bacterium]
MQNDYLADGIVIDETPDTSLMSPANQQEAPLSLDQIKMDDVPDEDLIAKSAGFQKVAGNGRPPVWVNNKIRSAFSDPKWMGDDETEGKRQALTAYYANGKAEDIPAVYSSLDTFIEKFHGKPLSVDQAYGEIGAILNGQKAPESKSAMGSYLKNMWHLHEKVTLGAAEMFNAWQTEHGIAGVSMNENGIQLDNAVTVENREKTRKYKELEARESKELGSVEFRRQNILSRSGGEVDPTYALLMKTAYGSFYQAMAGEPLAREEAEKQLNELAEEESKLKKASAFQKKLVSLENSPREDAAEFLSMTVKQVKEDITGNKPDYDAHPDMDPVQVYNKYGAMAATKKLGIVIAE